jgi:hypothetical protein
VPSDGLTLDRVVHRPLGNHPKQYIVLTRDERTWQPGEPYPRADGQHWRFQRGSTHRVIDWQGSGQDFQLLALQQHRDAPAWRLFNSQVRTIPPACGETMGEAWDRCGMAYRGDVYADGEVSRLEGLIHGVARAGLSRPLGPSRAILTWPNTAAPAAVEDAYGIGKSIVLVVLLTGEPQFASAAQERVQIAVDGAEPLAIASGDPEERRFRTTVVSPGTHNVVVRRLNSRGQVVPGSEMRFTYFVGEPSGLRR